MRPRRRKPFRLVESQPDLFEWANAMASRNSATLLPRAVRIIARRHNLSPTIARLVAEQAGFFMGTENG